MSLKEYLAEVRARAEKAANPDTCSHYRTILSQLDVEKLLRIIEKQAEALEKVEKAAAYGSVGACRMWAREALSTAELIAKGEK